MVYSSAGVLFLSRFSTKDKAASIIFEYLEPV